MIEFDAIVLAGGGSRRFGSDKLAHPIAGRALLDHTLDAVADAARIIVVGPPRATERVVAWCQEEPPGGGPLAGVAAGLQLTSREYVVLLAGDMPNAAPAVSALLQAATSSSTSEIVVMADASGRLSPLTALWRRAHLAVRLQQLDTLHGGAMMLLYESQTPLVITADDDALADVDTPDDLMRPE